MSASPMNVGIIGCGVISTAYIRGGARSRHIQVKSVADIREDAARSQASAMGVGYATIDEMLADPSIEIVINLTVPNAHAEVSTRILEAGKHVYSEKPLTVSVEEANALLQLAAKRGLRVGCAPDTFLGASHQACRALLDDGKIGTVLGGAASFLSRGMEAWHPNPDFFFKPGGGPVLDLGPYYITTLVNLLGPVRTVTATASTGYPTRKIGSGDRAGEEIAVETPTSYSALLTFESGARFSLDASWDVWKHQRSPIEIYGTEGSLLVPDPNFFGDEPKVTERGGDWQAVDISAFAFGERNRTLRTGREVADHRSIGVVDMALAIRQGRPHRASGELALHVLDVLLAIGMSAAESRVIEIGSSCERPLPISPGLDETVFEVIDQPHPGKVA
ncbi:Gfo/Idh/MocA family protein [Rhizobium sp. BT-226]|uniref:Gfo/Idh/MocA family protein n=1 Tax=Rhizobium sp. BT-226 TaxID=2986922 RepID=UPI0021F75C36|nr:Gfo/Idh/MocA family oxidoreductase [Rhizobium sp. BT-226]MCW0021315.1 Gfo/Idh/MocA family oxidoreductase [Rhizobium sp. BT-226]